MIQVLFVCLGNICRSPMAEAVFRHKLQAKGLEGRVNVDSAGTGSWHTGKPPHEGTRHVLDREGISYAGMAARTFHGGDFKSFDYIVCMDQSNGSNVRQVDGGEEAELMFFMDLLPHETLREVPDPYFTGNFDEVYRLIDAGCEELVRLIASENGWS